MQSETKSRVDQLTSPAGHPVTVLRFEGDIASTSKEAVLGTYQALPKETVRLVLLDFTKVDYINSSGIALVIQMLIEASNSDQKVYAFGLSRALHQGLHHGGDHQVCRAFLFADRGAGGAVGLPSNCCKRNRRQERLSCVRHARRIHSLKRPKMSWALHAAESPKGPAKNRHSITQGLKTVFYYQLFTARLKSCPATKRAEPLVFSQPLKSCPDTSRHAEGVFL